MSFSFIFHLLRLLLLTSYTIYCTPSLHIAQQVAVSSWDRHWQILIGAFLDRSACQSAYHCATVDDVLVLNRQNGHLLQYSFTFGNQYHVFDNRLQAFLRDGLVITARVQTVDTSSFTWQASLDASITSEELY